MDALIKRDGSQDSLKSIIQRIRNAAPEYSVIHQMDDFAIIEYCLLDKLRSYEDEKNKNHLATRQDP